RGARGDAGRRAGASARGDRRRRGDGVGGRRRRAGRGRAAGGGARGARAPGRHADRAPPCARARGHAARRALRPRSGGARRRAAGRRWRDDERAARVEALRARLARLGDVNPAALTELEELRGRHEFLVGQRTDLERSLDDLRRTITKLIRTSRRRFEETFAAANEKLAEVFPKLFPGGKARLEQTEPEEGGEPGVEIVVQPAG